MSKVASFPASLNGSQATRKFGVQTATALHRSEEQGERRGACITQHHSPRAPHQVPAVPKHPCLVFSQGQCRSRPS